MSVLLTGATGFVGTEVLARLLRDGEDVVALVRDERRLDPVLGAHVRAVRGDLVAPELSVPDDITAIVHCAASVSFALPLDEARAINVEGTRAMLDLAERLGVERFVHVSTAYVAGRHRGRFGEDDLWVGQEFRNSYERSKAEAEQLVHDRDLPSVVVRPSIVMGDSRTGWTPAFNVLYWPLRAYARGLLTHVPAAPDARVDIVPVDYVADAIVHVLRERPEARGVINATAGDDAVTVERLAELAAAALGRGRPRLAVEDGGGLAQRSEEAARYLPYFDMSVV